MWNLSSLTRDRTCTPCFGSQTLNRWTAREVPRTSVFKLCQAIWSAARNENPGLAGCYSPFLRKVSDQGSRCQPCLSHACQVETLDSHPTLTKPGKNLGSPSYLWPVSETGLAVFNNVQWAWWCHQGSSLFPVSISFFFFFKLWGLWSLRSWFPHQGLNLGPPQWKHRVLTTGPPGNSPFWFPVWSLAVPLDPQPKPPPTPLFLATLCLATADFRFMVALYPMSKLPAEVWLQRDELPRTTVEAPSWFILAWQTLLLPNPPTGQSPWTWPFNMAFEFLEK